MQTDIQLQFSKVLRIWVKIVVLFDCQDCVLGKMRFVSEYKTRASEAFISKYLFMLKQKYYILLFVTVRDFVWKSRYFLQQWSKQFAQIFAEK